MPIGSLIGGALGVASNLINNAQQQSMYDTSLNWQKFQYQDMKKYNSAQQQVMRLRGAGINPSLAFGSDTGTAQATSSPGAANTQPLDMNGLAAIAQNIELNAAQRRNLDANTAKASEETEGVKTENAFKVEQNLSQLANRSADTWYKQSLRENLKLGNSYLEQTMKDRVWQAKMESQEAQARAYAQQYLLPYVPLKAQAELENLAANTKLALQSGIATLKQAYAAIMNSKTARDSFKAQYGDNPTMWKQFSKATLNYLIQQKQTSSSQEFRNITFGLKDVPWTDYHEYNKFNSRYKNGYHPSK